MSCSIFIYVSGLHECPWYLLFNADLFKNTKQLFVREQLVWYNRRICLHSANNGALSVPQERALKHAKAGERFPRPSSSLSRKGAPASWVLPRRGREMLQECRVLPLASRGCCVSPCSPERLPSRAGAGQLLPGSPSSTTPNSSFKSKASPTRPRTPSFVPAAELGELPRFRRLLSLREKRGMAGPGGG